MLKLCLLNMLRNGTSVVFGDAHTEMDFAASLQSRDFQEGYFHLHKTRNRLVLQIVYCVLLAATVLLDFKSSHWFAFRFLNIHMHCRWVQKIFTSVPFCFHTLLMKSVCCYCGLLPHLNAHICEIADHVSGINSSIRSVKQWKFYFHCKISKIL